MQLEKQQKTLHRLQNANPIKFILSVLISVIRDSDNSTEPARLEFGR